MKNKSTRPVLLFMFYIMLAIFLSLTACGSKDETATPGPVENKQSEIKFWTCSMHPQIQQLGPGQCPICAMDLIPVKTDPGETGEAARELKLSKRAIKLAEIQTVPVERKFVTAEIRLDGKIDYDESRLSYITAWVPGRIERLYVDYTGVRVKKGDHLVELYSPELITAQQELLLGLKMLQGKSGSLRKSSLKNVESTREKLRLWGLNQQQIKKVERTGKVSDRTTIYSPISGIVIHKNGVEGEYLKTGTRIYTIADLSQVWLKLDAYESDLVWIRYGQDIAFTVNAYPGDVFKGKITFIDPILNSETRTIKVRVNVQNQDGNLKPNMFVSAVVYPKVAAGGRVMDPVMANKWICPMHPEIVKDKKNNCDICGMPLVTSESLGYLSINDADIEASLVIPVTAPLITGKRAVVYVAVPEKPGTFAGRDVVLGPRAGDYYLVKDGLQEGERVVTNGNFKIDSAIQIQAKPSMMNPEGGAAATGHEHHLEAPAKPGEKASPDEPETIVAPTAFIGQIDGLLTEYYNMQQALSHDNYKEAVDSSGAFMKKLDSVDMGLLSGKAHMAWMSHLASLKKSVNAIAAAKDINTVRDFFDDFSDRIYTIIKQFGISTTQPAYRFFCPMANDNKGAYWLQNKTGTENPYFGSKMFKCGSQVETVSPGRVEAQPEGTTHE
jgi:Cu(I)/Ag(I) efflux system membrane fusion protein